MEDYYNFKEVSNSDLSKLQDLLNGVEKPDPTAAYSFGRLIDCMITEPGKIDYFNYTCDGEQYTEQQFGQAENMKKAFFKDTLCSNMVKISEPQKVMIRHDVPFTYGQVEFKLNVRCKWDLWSEKLGWGADIKSTTATSQEAFVNAVKYFNYPRQRAWYMNIAGSKQDLLIGISKVNLKIFKVPIKFGDSLHTIGVQEYEYLAFEWFKRFGNIDSAIRKTA